MRSSSLISDITALLMRSQQELSRVFDFFSAEHFLGEAPRARAQGSTVSFAFGDVDGFYVSGDVHEDGTLQLTAQHGDARYTATLPTRSKSLSELMANIELRKGDQKETSTVSGEDFFKGTGISAEFAELHAKIIECVKRQMPWLFKASKAEQNEEAAPQTANVEASEPVDDKGLREFILRRSNGKPLKFTGTCLAGVRSVPQHGRYWEYYVFQTKGGKYVASKAGRSLWLGESDRVEVNVYEKLESVQEFFGDNPLALTLYRRLGFDLFEVID